MAKGFSLALLATLAILPALGHASTRPGGGTSCPATDIVVTITDFSFTPSVINIGAGTTVCWTYPTGISVHTATSDDGTSFASGALSPGQIYEHTFTTDGTFPYHCIYHGAAGGTGMAGTIQVGRAAAATAASSTTAPASTTPTAAVQAALPGPEGRRQIARRRQDADQARPLQGRQDHEEALDRTQEGTSHRAEPARG